MLPRFFGNRGLVPGAKSGLLRPLFVILEGSVGPVNGPKEGLELPLHPPKIQREYPYSRHSGLQILTE